MKIKLVYDKTNTKKEIDAKVIDSTNGFITEETVIKKIESRNKKNISKINKLTNGIKGLTKSTLGLGLASKEIIQERRSICDTCVHRDNKSCSICGCFIIPKTRVASEECPKGYWGTSNVKNNRRNNGCGCGKNKN
ncbi:MAG: hypothetical protein Unbinned97contig1000_17 [Prokaryotic dsDNA virus sp.]|nr:MAG: hypothetical protein Unbinned97contig1000_17 [Prokaryotic dsDNA virus sp.]|tara:strand:+ start:333 stop:740 length:408 start_codon:yes stop_codon:yes gene_type:complete